MNYKIITDEIAFKRFIDWLPELQPDEKYYMCLFARSKYTKDVDGNNGIAHIKSDKSQLKRFVTDKDRMFSKVKQLECEVGSYMQRDIPIPQEALALYITVNPRNMMKATVNTMVKLAHSIRDQNVMMNPQQEALSEIQKAKSRTCYVDFDFDGETIPTKEQITQVVNPEAVTILRTRGGIHLLIDPKRLDKQFENKFYMGLSKLPDVDQTGDQMIPCPGTYQGGFTPHFITL